jgi:hypothetical protein
VEQLNLLGVALGFAALAGINLYLTVFITGLAVNQHWITLSPQYQSLEVLGHPAVVGVAGVLYFLEFFADKIPWVDSAWDAVHTVIRPSRFPTSGSASRKMRQSLEVSRSFIIIRSSRSAFSRSHWPRFFILPQKFCAPCGPRFGSSLKN